MKSLNKGESEVKGCFVCANLRNFGSLKIQCVIGATHSQNVEDHKDCKYFAEEGEI